MIGKVLCQFALDIFCQNSQNMLMARMWNVRKRKNSKMISELYLLFSWYNQKKKTAPYIGWERLKQNKFGIGKKPSVCFGHDNYLGFNGKIRIREVDSLYIRFYSIRLAPKGVFLACNYSQCLLCIDLFSFQSNAPNQESTSIIIICK